MSAIAKPTGSPDPRGAFVFRTPFPESLPADELRVLGIDTSLRGTGLGLVAAKGSSMRSVWHETVRIPASHPLTLALLEIRSAVEQALESLCPAAVAVEGVFFAKFARSALMLGHARGVVLSCCAAAGVPVYEYPPTRVKQAVVGFGSAPKEQMQRMMQAMLRLDSMPPEDEGDALAIAVCHLHNSTGVAALRQEPL